jgi:hypothetical protein
MKRGKGERGGVGKGDVVRIKGRKKGRVKGREGGSGRVKGREGGRVG